MGSGFDDIKNGLIFGVLFGVAVTLIPWVQDNVLTIIQNWYPGTWITSSLCDGTIKTATTDATCTVKYLNFIVFGIIGGIIGAYIDAK